MEDKLVCDPKFSGYPKETIFGNSNPLPVFDIGIQSVFNALKFAKAGMVFDYNEMQTLRFFRGFPGKTMVKEIKINFLIMFI